MEETTSDADKTLSKQGWDTKKVGIAPLNLNFLTYLDKGMLQSL